MGEKAVEGYVCWAGNWTKQAELGWESRGPHTATLMPLSSKKKVSHKKRKSNKQTCLIYGKEEPLGAREALIE